MEDFNSVENLLKGMEGRSAILNRDNPAAKSGKIMSKRPIFGLDGLKLYLGEILDDRNDNLGNPIGLLKSARQAAKMARAGWEAFNKAQAPHARREKPYSHFRVKINEADARVKLLEKESRVIHKMIAEFEAKQEQKQKGLLKRPNKYRWASGRLEDGVVVEWAGRPVKDDRFVDDGELVSEYVERHKKLARERAKALRASTG